MSPRNQWVWFPRRTEGWKSAELFLGKRSDEPTGIKSDCGSNIQEFQRVQPSVAALVFGDVRRGLAKPTSDDCWLRNVIAFSSPGGLGRRGSPMRRREFITLVGSAAAAWPLAAHAQQDGTKRQITVWMGRANDAEGQRHAAAFREALQALGWADRRNVHVHY